MSLFVGAVGLAALILMNVDACLGIQQRRSTTTHRLIGLLIASLVGVALGFASKREKSLSPTWSRNAIQLNLILFAFAAYALFMWLMTSL